MPLIEEHINAMKDALEALRPRSTSRCASRGESPRDAQRDALLSELALDLPLTNCHRAVLEPSESRCKQTDKNDEMACSDLVNALRSEQVWPSNVRNCPQS